MIKFENGATLIVEASWAANVKEKELMVTQLFGTKGGLVQRNLDETYKFEAELYVEREGTHFDVKLHTPMPPVPSPMYHFADCILNDTPHIAPGEEGLLVMEILDALYKSAEEGRPVNVAEL